MKLNWIIFSRLINRFVIVSIHKIHEITERTLEQEGNLSTQFFRGLFIIAHE